MLRTLFGIFLLTFVVAGCGSQPRWRSDSEPNLFAPVAMRIHPVFTQLRDWTNDGKPDGIDVLIEFQDRFGDSAKAAGNVVFEIYSYRPWYPDPRGERLVPPFLASIDIDAAQRDHWNRTSRCYSFQLAWPAIKPGGTYVLTAAFEVAGERRFTDRLVIEPVPVEKFREQLKQPTTRPATQPSTEPAES